MANARQEHDYDIAALIACYVLNVAVKSEDRVHDFTTLNPIRAASLPKKPRLTLAEKRAIYEGG